MHLLSDPEPPMKGLCDYSTNMHLNLVEAYRAAHSTADQSECWICNYGSGAGGDMVSLFGRTMPFRWHHHRWGDLTLDMPQIK